MFQKENERERERREGGREHRYYLHNTRYHSLINYGNVSSRGASITQRVSSSADSLAGRDLSFLLDCQQRSRILRVAQRVWWAWCSSGCMRLRESGAEKKRTNEKRYRNGQERFLETNVSDLTLPSDLRRPIAIATFDRRLTNDLYDRRKFGPGAESFFNSLRRKTRKNC